jgi:hypothetical protein
MARRVCWRCIGEEVLSEEIKIQQPRRVCSYCGSRRPAITIADLAQRVDAVFQNIVGVADEGYVVRDGMPAWAPVGDYPSALMTEILEADDEEIGRHVVSNLANRHRFDVHDGGLDYYDDTSDHYTILDAEDDWFGRGWSSFCDELKHRRRFFLDQSAHVLEELFGPILREEWPPGGAIRTLGSEAEQRFIYRARAANDPGTQRTIYSELKRQLGAPAPGIAGAGRMNAPGIGVFYGSLDRDTCVAELRTPVGGSAIVGRFEILRPLRLLDLTRLEGVRERLSYFDPRYSERMAYAAFMSGFHTEVRRAVIPGQETLEYLPTQVIAEYLWAHVDPPVDGLIFGSSQITASSSNIVLFPHAATVEGAEEEVRRTIRHLYHRAARTDEDADDEDRQDRDIVSFVPIAEGGEGVVAQVPRVNDDDWFAALIEPVNPAVDPGPALRLRDDDVCRVRVEGIRYETHVIQAEFSDWKDWGF